MTKGNIEHKHSSNFSIGQDISILSYVEVTAVFMLNNSLSHHISHSDEPLPYHIRRCKIIHMHRPIERARKSEVLV